MTTAIAAKTCIDLSSLYGFGSGTDLLCCLSCYAFCRDKTMAVCDSGTWSRSAAAVVGYHLFSHIQVRVEAWQDPIGTYSGSGYQVAQSLFAIGTGSWFGTGLFKGQPDTIPVSETDFIFSAITEEMGVIYALCLILICVSCYVMFLNIAMELRNNFYKLIALGLGNVLYFSGFPANRRRHKIYSVYRNDFAVCKLWRKFDVKYDDYVWNHSGTIYYKRR